MVFLLQWAFCRAGQSCCSGGDTERRSHASASPTKTSPTWAITLLPRRPAAAKSPAAFRAGSSNASPFADRANQKAKPLRPTEEQAHRVTDVIIQRAAKGLFWAKPCKPVWDRLKPQLSSVQLSRMALHLKGFFFFLDRIYFTSIRRLSDY